MKKITILMATFLAMFSVNQSFATESWISGEALPDSAGSYYLYNVGAQKFLSAGADWGTHATVDTYGFATNLTKIRNGVYTIKTAVSNGGSKYYLNGLYCDGAVANWFIIPTDGNDNSYYLSSDSTAATYLGYDGTNIGLISGATGDNAKWYLISDTSRVSALKTAMTTASEASPVDITPMIPDPDFGRNRTDNKWQGSPSLGGNNVNYCAEKYNTTFDVYQELTGMKNGVYKVTCQGFYRDGGYADAATLHNNSTESLNMLLYINEATSPLVSIFADAQETSTLGGSTATVDGVTKYFPNSMTDASNYFSAGYYSANSVKVIVTDGTVKFGVKKTVAVSSDWSIFDAFRLYYLGVDLTAIKATITDRIAVAKEITGNMSSAAKTGLATVTADTYFDSSASFTEDELNAKLTEINTAISTANTSIANYVALNAAIADVTAKEATVLNGTVAGKTALDDLISAATKAYTECSYSDDEAVAEITALNAALVAYVETQTVDGSDYTLVIANNSFETGTMTPWTTSATGDTGVKPVSNATYAVSNADGSYVYNTWGATTLDVKQTLTNLPEGYYSVTALVASDAGNIINVYAGDKSIAASASSEGKGVGVDATTPFAYVEANGSLEIGANSTTWFKVDNFRMTYVKTAEATNIANMNTEVVAPNKVFNLNGQQVSSSVKGLNKGIYISNGRKFVVK
jgi:hypothetical protein